MGEKTFRDLEHEGWLTKADAYRDIFGTITAQAIAPILDTFGDLSGARFLDVGCGTGELTAAAASRGAQAEGLDFAATMIEKASQKYPHIEFREGDAEQLPHAGSSLDAVACSFGLLHMANPDRALREARRVLKAGGRYTFTVWCGPEQGGDLFTLVMGAIREHGTLAVDLPPAPPMFRFADAEESLRALQAAGFSQPTARRLELEWLAREPRDVLDLIYKSVVRTPMILLAQTEDARERIHEAIISGAEAYRAGDTIRFGFPALLATAVA
ncbi:MAG TPA: methyltransferase domain-containing protein [Kofleriaceae bacterium]